jgi:protein tyrosine phosphatase (PTP) superfamily phosphohydrolase (DUF442 family)
MADSPPTSPTQPASPPRTARASRTRAIVLALLAVAVATAGGAWWWHKTRPYHLLVCEPGVLYRSGRLAPEVLTEVIGRYGIKTVVNLKSVAENQEPWHAEAVQTAAAAGAKHLDLPMEPDTPPTPAQIDSWLSLFTDPERTPVIVHCQHGVIRTGMLVALYEMEFQGKDNQQALDDMVSFGHDLFAPSREPMREFLRSYARRGNLAPGRP